MLAYILNKILNEKMLSENNYSLLLCSNITNCEKVGEINRMNIPKRKKINRNMVGI